VVANVAPRLERAPCIWHMDLVHTRLHVLCKVGPDSRKHSARFPSVHPFLGLCGHRLLKNAGRVREIDDERHAGAAVVAENSSSPATLSILAIRNMSGAAAMGR
jgi:hypothetical protein